MVKTMMMVVMLGGFAMTLRAADEVKITQEEKTLNIEIGGKPWTKYYFADGKGAEYVRPFFSPILAPDGENVTSDQLETNPKDHPHHRSLWVAHGDVNGADHWALKPDCPKQKHLKFTKIEASSFEQELEWEDKAHAPLLKEVRTIRVFVFPDGARGVDVTSVFTPIHENVTFGDTKEAGLCSVRMRKEISNTGVLTNAAGGTGEKECWGKPAAWCDISGKIGEKSYGIAVLDAPTNPKHPSTWHVRQYGLLAANIFALHEYDKSKPKGAGNFTIEKGSSATFKYRVVIHAGDAKSADLDAKWKEFAGK
jgi:hypothetical protein